MDIPWWLEQIKHGIEWRRQFTDEEDWKTYRSYYRGEFIDDLFTKNIMYMMKRIMVPKIYFRNPKISILPKKPGPRHMALAKIMNTIDNNLISSMGLKREMKKMTSWAYDTGTGVLKLGFGAQYTPTPMSSITEAPITKEGFRSEYRRNIVPNMPFVCNIPLNNYIQPAHIMDVESAFFQGHIIHRYKDDILNDERFAKVLKQRGDRVSALNDKDHIIFDLLENKREVVKLIEIRDRRTRKVIILAPNNADKPLFFEDDELQTSYSSPFYIYTPNPNDDIPYGVSDASILLPYQDQLNEIRTKKHAHVRLSLVKVLAEKGAIKPEEADKLLSEDVNAIVKIATGKLSAIKIIEASKIPDSLIRMEDEIVEDAREAMGFSRNSFAQFQARSHGPTATEVAEVKKASELRIDERRDDQSDIVAALFRDLHLIIFKHWTHEQVIRVIGEDGLPTWVEFTGRMLQEGEYEVQIEPDASVSETAGVREERARRTYAELRQDPNIDPRKLTAYRLNETPGVSVDDLLLPQQSPAMAQGQNVISLDQFAQQQARQTA